MICDRLDATSTGEKLDIQMVAERKPRVSRNEKHWSRISLLVCSLYVGLPAILGVISAGILLTGSTPRETSQGLLLCLGLGLVVGSPLVVLQAIAVSKHGSWAAILISRIYWLINLLLLIGVVQLLLIGSDDETPIQLWPDVVVLLTFLFLNQLTALRMGKYGRSRVDQ